MADGPWVNYQSQSGAPWQRYGGTQVKQAPPGYGNLQPKSDVDLQQSQLNLQKTAGTLAADETSAKNAAVSSGIKAKSDQIDFNIKSGVIPGNPALKGDDYLASLPAGMADTVRAYDQGRMGVPLNMRSPQQMQLIGALNHYDPSFDAGRYNTRLAALKSGAVGRLGDTDNALNTAIAHAGMLYDQASGTPQQPGPAGHDLGSFPLSGPLSMTVNALDNWSHKGSPGQVTYNDTAQKLAGEEAKAYGIGTGGERDAMLSHFDPNLPLNSKQASIHNAMDLFASKMAANLHQFQWGNMGNSKPSLDLLNPDARATLQRIAPDVLDKYFSRSADPMAAAIGISSVKDGNNPPPRGPTGGGTPGTPPDYSPMAPSGMSGFNSAPVSPRSSTKTVYDPQTSSLVNGYLKQGLSYSAAVSQLAKDAPGAQLNSAPSQWNAALQWRQQHPNATANQADATKTTQMSLGDRAMNAVAQSGPGAFYGNYANAMAFGLPKLAAGQDQAALFDSASKQNNPAQAFAGDLVGTLGGLSLANRGVGATAKALEKSFPSYANSIAGSAPRQALTGDTIYGGISGAADNPDHPVLGAATNMAAMAAGNAAGRFVGVPVAAAIADTRPGQAVINGARSLGAMARGGTPTPFSPPAAPAFPMSNATQSALPDITGKLQQAQSAGLPYMIADADPRLRAMLGSAGRFSPDVQANAENILQPRQSGQGERAIGQINTNLAPVGDIPTLQSQLLKTAQTQSSPLYTAAKAQPVPELTANPKLQEVLDRPAGQAAIRSGYETALNKGEDVGTLTYATDPNGNPVQYGNPSWNVIHYARQALDASGDTDVRQALDKQIALLNPGFKQADAAYSGVMKGSDALQAGADATGIKVTPEATQRAMAGFPNNGSQFQQGYASNMADQIESQRLSGNPYNLVNGSLGQQSKLGMVFPQGADNFNTAQSLEGDMSKTYQALLGNSMTQNKAMADRAFSLGDMADGGMDVGNALLSGGNPVTALGGLLVRKGIDAARYGMNREKADAIAPFLMNPDPTASLAGLNQWAQQNAARKAYLNQVGAGAGQFGAGLFGAPAIYGLSQN